MASPAFSIDAGLGRATMVAFNIDGSLGRDGSVGIFAERPATEACGRRLPTAHGYMPVGSIYCGKPCEGCEAIGRLGPCGLLIGHAQGQHVCAGGWTQPHICAVPCCLHPP
eukprot:6566939-Heterocapsa_arctica.AAC.1